MKRAQRDYLREEQAKTKLYAEMPLSELAPIAAAEGRHGNKCCICLLCIEHPDCLDDHPPPPYCSSADHHYTWRTRQRARRYGAMS